MKFSSFKAIDFVRLDSSMSVEILRWRNHFEVRRRMHNSSMISMREHIDFVEALKKDVGRSYWLITYNDEPYAVCYVVGKTGSKPFWGYYLAPELLNTGVGLDVALYACWLFKGIGLSMVFGEVLKVNENNIALQKTFGSIVERKSKSIVFLTDLTVFPVRREELKEFKKSIILERNKNE